MARCRSNGGKRPNSDLQGSSSASSKQTAMQVLSGDQNLAYLFRSLRQGMSRKWKVRTFSVRSRTRFICFRWKNAAQHLSALLREVFE